jgi:phosphatidylserine/phosphatidylglycerophosphate/cardiolipin synthase-like enzyme
LHSRIDGPAACDILTNFKERWLRASKQHRDAQHKFESYYADIINGMKDIPSQSHNDPEDWHVQVYWMSIFYGSQIFQFLMVSQHG